MNRNTARDTVKRLAIIIIIFAALGIVGNLVSYMANLGREPVETQAPTEATEPPKEWGEVISLPADNMQNLKIEWVAGTVTLRTGDVKEIQIQETAAKKDLDYTVYEDGLLIRYSSSSMKSLLGVHSKNGKDLVVTLPRDWEGKLLELQAVNANSSIRRIQLEKMAYDGVSGILTMEDSKVGELDVQTVSGNVSLSGELQALKCQGVSNDCNIRLSNVPEALEIKGVSGGLQMELPEQAGFTVEMDGVSTGLETDFAGSETDGKFVSGDGSCRIAVDGISGNVKIQKAK